jgi:CMP/dCMP kinase
VIITIAREVGSHGEDVGRAAADALGLPYFDHEIIAQAARIANVSVQTIEQAERTPSLLSRMIQALGRYPAGFEMAESAPAIAAPPLSSDSYRHFIEQVIRGVAGGIGAVIVGHASMLVLRAEPHTLHVRICAPFEQRARAFAAAEGIAPEEAKRRTRQADQERTAYYQRYYGVDWREPSLYDLTLNTGRMRIGAAAGIVASVARGRT